MDASDIQVMTFNFEPWSFMQKIFALKDGHL